jgi:hypothetical protein
MVGGILLGLLLAFFAAMAWQVEDWSRDWTTNFAATDPQAADATLHPPTIPAGLDEVTTWFARFAAARPQWQIREEISDPPQARLHLERTTRLWRFVDDVHATLTETDGGVLVELTSQSRVGKGDLGQNPRNLREILTALRSELGGGS